MGPAKLRELKTQLQEFLEKTFIQPCLSPWGAPVCLARPDKEVQVRMKIGKTLDFTEDDGGRRV